jgi:hypothetical protein
METLIPKTDPTVVEEMMAQGLPLVSPQKAIAARIPNNKVLSAFIRAIAPENRLQVYEGLVPYLSFKAKSYWWLMSQKVRKHAS